MIELLSLGALEQLQFDFLPSQLPLEGNSILKIARGCKQHMLSFCNCTELFQLTHPTFQISFYILMNE